MTAKKNIPVFEFEADYSGLLIKFLSDEKQLLEIEFIKVKQKINKNRIPDPIDKTLSYLDDYFCGVESKIEIVFNTAFSEEKIIAGKKRLMLDMNGYTEKEISIYRELLKIRPGSTTSYGELALKSGIQRGARFAGNCMAANRFPVIIPCHRVINKNGSIGNYSGGEGIKEFLLAHETNNFN